MSRDVIISPHLDDAVLSCWSILERPGSIVMTLFAGLPDSSVSTFWDRLCGQPNSSKMMRLRLKENRQVLDSLGVKAVNLPYLDNQYKPSPRDLVGIADKIMSLTKPGDNIYAPLAVGGIRRHADHLVAQQVGILLAAQGRKVSFYGDEPYILPLFKLKNWPVRIRLSRIEKKLVLSLSLEVRKLTTGEQQRKEKAVRAYSSQFAMLNLFALGLFNRGDFYKFEVIFQLK
jgi:LmbE family N-acetylglucosaminyl deacetylase